MFSTAVAPFFCSHQQVMQALILLVFANTYFMLFDCDRPNRCEVPSHCGFVWVFEISFNESSCISLYKETDKVSSAKRLI